MPDIVVVKNLVKQFPLGGRLVLTAVNDVSLAIGRRQTLGLVGESGSGKTTVGRCLLRLIEPTSGDMYFDGEPIAALSQRAFRRFRPRMQAVFQDPFESLDPRITVGDTILESVALWDRSGSRRQQRDKLLHLAELVRLRPDQLNLYPRELSGGQQQRVGIARALATDPEFVVLDEPSSSLDPLARAEVIELLIRLQQELGLSYLFISHDLMTVRHIAQTVAVMYLGHVVELGETASVFDSPRHPYTQALLSAVLTADPAARGRIKLLQGEIPSPVNLPAICPFASRCPVAFDRCRAEKPTLLETTARHRVACFRAHERPEEFVDWFELAPASVNGAASPGQSADNVARPAG
jgi:oligopeptide/dipeptide ABC transporter ATP-binding protein